MKNSEEIKNLIKTAKNLTKNQEFEKALEILEGILKENTDIPEIKKTLIDTLFAFGGYLNDFYILKYEEARKMFEKIIKIEPDNYRGHYNLGLAYFNLGEIKNARKSFKKALKFKPNYKYCFYNLGLVFEEVQNYRKALGYYEKALKIDPHFIYAVTARSQVREKLDEIKQK